MLAERLRYVTRVASKNCQRVAILNSYVFAFHCQHTAFLETTQQAADGFNRQTQVVTDVAAGHGQVRRNSRGENPRWAKRRDKL